MWVKFRFLASWPSGCKEETGAQTLVSGSAQKMHFPKNLKAEVQGQGAGRVGSCGGLSPWLVGGIFKLGVLMWLSLGLSMS